jgi:hypothetical protein
MIQHIYDSNYNTHLSSQELIYYVKVFAAADKYDVSSLRVLVVSKFTVLMGQKWSSSQQEFCTVIKHLCGPNAIGYADFIASESRSCILLQKYTEPYKTR